MENAPPSRIMFAERLDGGVVVTFEDGRSAIYSASFLDQAFPQAQELIDEPENDDT